MCGIFGVIARADAPLTGRQIQTTVDRLFRLSESRGKEAAGLAMVRPDKIIIYKDATSASKLIRRSDYRSLYNGQATGATGPTLPQAIIGHSRLVTTGGEEKPVNNQPVVSPGTVGIHNGIIVNHEELWRQIPDIPRVGEVVSVVITALVGHFIAAGVGPAEAIRKTFSMLRGAASVALAFLDFDALALASNTGSLYVAAAGGADLAIFASERYILQQLLADEALKARVNGAEPTQICPGQGLFIELGTLKLSPFALTGEARLVEPIPQSNRQQVVEIGLASGSTNGRHSLAPIRKAAAHPPSGIDAEGVAALRRCTRCVLPETMPFIEYDGQGVCNYCRSFQRIEIYGRDALMERVAPYRRRDGGPDCLVGLSGGRDSSYGLHYIKAELGMNPIAFTYDWGMVTDLARRNISRLCGQLGIEHILVSANIARKRENIRKNVQAWLRRPALGMIPLFMAGDKQYFFQAKRLRRQTGLPVIMLCENMLEQTHFKSGFSGVRPSNIDPDHVYTLPVLSKLQMLRFYATQYLTNPGYLNSSLPDTVFAYACYYLISKDYVNLYRYVEWDEDTLNQTLRSEYDWELATDTTTTWRIGDGTASFYNYIYATIAGFTENDTFRSNQIRQGIITREQALQRIAVENQPRWESIRWYCEIIGVDFEDAVKRINAAPKLYGRSAGRARP